MNDRQVHKFVQRYLETTECRVIEKSPAHFLVKLSPRADRDLTNRPFYWGFVDRTGAEPETMSLLLVTDKRKYDASIANTEDVSPNSTTSAPAARPVGAPYVPATGTALGAASGSVSGSVSGSASGATSGLVSGADTRAGNGVGAASAPQNNTTAVSAQEAAANAALGRSLGYVHGSLQAPRRVPREDLYYGSRKLEQLFQSARSSGSYVCLFQEPDNKRAHPLHSTAYTAWLGITFKVEFACDMKREELHSVGVSLATGQHTERFHESLLSLRMTPRLPPNVHTAKNGLTLAKAAAIAEQQLERKIKAYDYGWADAASERLRVELEMIAHYYEPLIKSADEESLPAITEQFTRRQDEIRWQYEPRVSVSAINCGIFYLQGIE